jgi:hypothetical protein
LSTQSICIQTDILDDNLESFSAISDDLTLVCSPIPDGYSPIEVSFYIQNSCCVDGGLFVGNQNISKRGGFKGLSFLFPAFKLTKDNDSIELIERYIKDSILVISKSNYTAPNITFYIEEKALCYDKDNNTVVLIYEVSFNQSLCDILYFDRERDIFRYLFQVDLDFIKESCDYFFDRSNHIDIVSIKGVNNKDTIKIENSLLYTLSSNKKSIVKLNIDFNQQKESILKELRDYFKEHPIGAGGVVDATISSTDTPFSDFVNFIMCLYQVGFGTKV